MIICNKCSSTLPNDAKFCTGCGSAIEVEQSTNLESPKGIPKRKNPIIFGTVGIILIALVLSAVFFFKDGGTIVEFNVLSEEQFPEQLAYEIIPEYKQMERALACVVDGKIYVIAARGEKPTAGYEIAIDKIKFAKDDNTKLIVYAKFTDPDPSVALVQTLSYPFQVAEIQLDEMPAEIELEIKYVD